MKNSDPFKNYTEAQKALFAVHSHLEEGDMIDKNSIVYYEEKLVEAFTKLREKYFQEGEDKAAAGNLFGAKKLWTKVELLDEMVKFLKHEVEVEED